MQSIPSGNSINGTNDSSQTLVNYLKYENERLENKLLLIQTELDVEKTRSEQMKEVFLLQNHRN